VGVLRLMLIARGRPGPSSGYARGLRRRSTLCWALGNSRVMIQSTSIHPLQRSMIVADHFCGLTSFLVGKV
jgi:hypothetical protein